MQCLGLLFEELELYFFSSFSFVDDVGVGVDRHSVGVGVFVIYAAIVVFVIIIINWHGD